ncbi:MAG: hypothetical protein A3G33_01765 [Omnitrophica bacterium RIFCSPLOWO2_12_FULL_44_17]|uniref:Polymerase nucleotidyl transferase domain-containing protein n=1 Tax=Candidatus Danuiimicrobium aquiferis TaxID=1801832 RepID=A0A1G1KVC2_9BACT|nr:MAG: hypothetical protein A3B72_00995 [Omnitrophica bacterium RIFCSPHIGHO2_02_FULL_45_28]OGW92173.1 MAG: hypothetical protein A3E74_08640 [Omnitrophica bacterium RIFCSPHIGHO2_12_FULL_44_12]OGW96841.1 MAG: hypothetical protein A3G33_01765 [Omnitrophica bacterium RIFCSPLOWO2_12_FULL_44_17]OGX03842.1 MAG: hypothetical protein A3J12_09665 [Omnitrophica bacterium RIFCSPLOWO2_02_FULL_44_11]
MKTSLKTKEKTALAEFVSKVKRSLGKDLVSLHLFGSKARSASQKGSDVDVLVVVSRFSADIKNAVIDIAFDVNLKFDVYISPRVVPARIFSARVWRITPFVQNIRRESIPL